MLIGGQAVLVHGEPRVTKDIDITLGADVSLLPIVKGIAESLSLRPLEGQTDAFVKQAAVFSVVQDASGIRVDFIFSYTPYEQQAIKRALTVKLGEAYVRVATIEDTIVHKMFAGRPRDIEDVRGIVAKKSGYDREYLRNWLSLFSTVAEKDLWSEFVKVEKSIGK